MTEIPPCPWSMRHRFLKRAIDLMVASGALLMLAIPMCIIALAIRLTSPGPAFFSQVRIGRGGRPFRILKFRSMIDRAASLGSSITAAGDPRVTAVGRFLRSTKLDEVPQLVNVLVGDMSLVGPRPEVLRYVETYRPDNRLVLSVRPGITDPASIAFRNEEEILAGHEDPERCYLDIILPEKLAMARQYILEASLLRDVSVLLGTLKAVVRTRAERTS